MNTELIVPNLHVVLIHYPLAMLTLGVLIEFFSFLWPRSAFRTAGRWMIFLGALSTIPAVFSGIYAFKAIGQANPDQHWMDYKASSPVLSQPEIWNALRRHTLYNAVASGVAVGAVLFYVGASDRIRRSLHVVLLLVMVGAIGAMVYGSWFGGEMIYHHGVGVSTTQPTVAAQPTTGPVSWMDGPTQAEQMFPPLELHITMAGFAIAMAVVAIALSFRRINSGYDPAEEPIVTAPGPNGPRAVPTSVDMGRMFNPDLEVVHRPYVPAARFWMLAFLLALITLSGGLFVLARGADAVRKISENPKQTASILWDNIKPDKDPPKNYRHLAHGVAGSAIVVLPLLLALLVRFAPRERVIFSLLTLLLVLAVSAEIWLGILLYLDTEQGPINKFNPPSASLPVAVVDRA